MLTNYDLIDICRRNQIHLNSVIMKDTLKSLNKSKNMKLIVNLQSSSQGDGTHWLVLIIKGSNCLYFDSFGVIPCKEIIRFCKGKRLGYSAYIIQDINSTQCGLYCIALLHFMQYNKGDFFELFNDFINLFVSNTKVNDKILFRYFKTNEINVQPFSPSTN